MRNFVVNIIAFAILFFALIAVSLVGGLVIWILWPLTGQHLGLPAMPYVNCVALHLLASVILGLRRTSQ